MRVLATAWLLSACGRLDFDPTALGYRRQLTIDNGATVSLPTGYATRIPLANVASKALASYADVRVLDQASPSTSLGYPRFVELDASEGDALWIALPAAIADGASGEYWLYYGDPDLLAPVADPAQVFALYDDFTTPMLASTWLTMGSWTTGGPGLVLAPGGDSALTSVPGAVAVPAQSSFEARMSVTAPTSASNYYWIGYQGMGDFAIGAPFLNWVGGAGVPGFGALVYAWANDGTINMEGPMAMQDGASHRYRIDRGASAVTYYRDGTGSFQLALTDASSYSIELRNQSTANTVIIDWVRARQLVLPEPAIEIGGEQQL